MEKHKKSMMFERQKQGLKTFMDCAIADDLNRTLPFDDQWIKVLDRLNNKPDIAVYNGGVYLGVTVTGSRLIK